VEEIESGTVEKIEGIITGEPRVSMKPTATQKWVKNKRAGGGAVIPCNWLLHVTKGGELQKSDQNKKCY